MYSVEQHRNCHGVAIRQTVQKSHFLIYIYFEFEIISIISIRYGVSHYVIHVSNSRAVEADNKVRKQQTKATFTTRDEYYHLRQVNLNETNSVLFWKCEGLACLCSLAVLLRNIAALEVWPVQLEGEKLS